MEEDAKEAVADIVVPIYLTRITIRNQQRAYITCTVLLTYDTISSSK